MKKLLIMSVATVMVVGVSLGAMAQLPPPCAMPGCPAAVGNFDGNGQGRGPGYGPGRYGGRGACGGMYSGPMRGGYMWRDLNLTDEQIAKINDARQQQRQETHNRVRDILTPEQQAIFDQRTQAWWQQGMQPPAAQQ